MGLVLNTIWMCAASQPNMYSLIRTQQPSNNIDTVLLLLEKTAGIIAIYLKLVQIAKQVVKTDFIVVLVNVIFIQLDLRLILVKLRVHP